MKYFVLTSAAQQQHEQKNVSKIYYAKISIEWNPVEGHGDKYIHFLNIFLSFVVSLKDEYLRISHEFIK